MGMFGIISWFSLQAKSYTAISLTFWAWNASGSFHKMYSRGKKTNSKLTVADKHRTKKGLFTQQGIRLGGLCKLTWRCYLFQKVTYEKLKESTRN